MSTAANTDFTSELDCEAQALDRRVRSRTVEASLREGDGRTLDLRLAPYNQPATVADPPDWRPYREMFLPGAFERQLSAPDRVRVWLNFEHEQGLRGIVGHGVTLAERSDGLYGSFRVHENADGEKALGLVREGLLTGLSLEFAALRSRRVEGVVQRLRAHIDRVSLTRFPAYQAAQVLAMREDPEELGSSEVAGGAEGSVGQSAERGNPAIGHTGQEVGLAAIPLDPELADRLAALDLTPLHRVATVSKTWDGSPARFSDDEYQRSALFCRPGDDPPKQRCSLPVLEPDGTLNVNALAAAAAVLAGARGGLTNASRQQKAAAARKLLRYYNAAGMEPPESLKALAGRS